MGPKCRFMAKRWGPNEALLDPPLEGRSKTLSRFRGGAEARSSPPPPL